MKKFGATVHMEFALYALQLFLGKYPAQVIFEFF